MALDIRTNPEIPDGMIGDGTGGGYLLKVNSDGSINTTPTGGAAETVALGATGVAANAPSNASTTAYAASAVVKASAGLLYGFSGYNSKASAQFILFFDSATVPADTAQAVLVITVPGQSNFSYNPGIYGRKFTTGIAWSNSSTSPTKTIGSADCFLDAQYA